MIRVEWGIRVVAGGGGGGRCNSLNGVSKGGLITALCSAKPIFCRTFAFENGM